MSERFYGKYRGKVTDVRDPMQMGRVRAEVPDVLGDHESGWAMPCFPAAGSSMGVFALPKVGAGVWIEFEQGRPDYPIWSGAWYGGASELPTSLMTPPMMQDGKILLCTSGGNSVLIDDTPGTGGIILETSGGQKIKLTAQGIEIDNGMGGKISLQGPKVDVNSGALEVM
ncbi:MAG TPA: phage baseplate assembly protein V [Candidatus Didemnitutus sp.]|nr:phage baseplate assembly protein V [Candidatus Didemnitutus sp.]